MKARYHGTRRWLARGLLATTILAGVLVSGTLSMTRTAAAAGSPVQLKLLVIGGAIGDPTNAEIANTLCVNTKTVEGHLRSSYRKLSIRSRGQLRALLDSGATSQGSEPGATPDS